jgi:hypothetical protein
VEQPYATWSGPRWFGRRSIHQEKVRINSGMR